MPALTIRQLIIILFCMAFMTPVCINAQDNADLRKTQLRNDLDSLAVRDTSYNRCIDVSVTNFSVFELIKGIAISGNLSIDMNFDKHKSLTCNFNRIPIKDVLYFICTEKSIDAEIIGNIVTLTDYVPPVEIPDIVMTYDIDSSRISFDFRGCNLGDVARKYNALTGVNMLIPTTLYDRQVSAFGTDMTIDESVQTIAMLNGLYARKENERNWVFSKTDVGGKRVQKEEDNSISVTVYPMKYRTVDNITEIIPTELKQGMEIKTFHDLNSIIISGNTGKADRITAFLDNIDKSVPLISIDVIIVDATNSTAQSTGLGIGVGTSEIQPQGTASPGIDITLNAESLNRILGSFQGFGSINLGQVGSLFYADLQLLEEAGNIALRSTPRLSTLNGHKATLKSGEVKYYKESQVNIIGTQNPLQSESYLWKNVEANFVLDIIPHVSCDSTITLSVNLSQDEFTTTDGDDQYAPPGISKRSFNSIVKVKDGEMVLLGGIEKNLTDNSAKGLPYVTRVPFLRSLFGKSKKSKTDSKLNIFIKPTIVP